MSQEVRYATRKILELVDEPGAKYWDVLGFILVNDVEAVLGFLAQQHPQRRYKVEESSHTVESSRVKKAQDMFDEVVVFDAKGIISLGKRLDTVVKMQVSALDQSLAKEQVNQAA